MYRMFWTLSHNDCAVQRKLNTVKCPTTNYHMISDKLMRLSNNLLCFYLNQGAVHSVKMNSVLDPCLIRKDCPAGILLSNLCALVSTLDCLLMGVVGSLPNYNQSGGRFLHALVNICEFFTKLFIHKISDAQT